jgi:hypothetical protein
LYVDAIQINVRDNGLVNKAAHLIVSVDEGQVQTRARYLDLGDRGYEGLAAVLTDPRQRGRRDVLIMCCDGYPMRSARPGRPRSRRPARYTCCATACKHVPYGDLKIIAAATYL